MQKRCYYEVLGVARSADESEIKTAFRRMAMKSHPDRCPDDPKAHERFQEAKEAYDVLGHAQKRAMYDQHGHGAFANGGQGAGGFGHGDVGDIFGDIFSDIFGRGTQRGQARRGADLRYVIELELEEAIFGISREIHVPTQVQCETCTGSGSADGKTDTCATCNGHGRVRMQNGIFSVQQACPHCHGAGESIANPCSDCRGQGRTHQDRTLSVDIPAGVDSGDRIRLNGQGEAGPAGSTPGDLYVEVRVREHAIFQREGNDLYCEIPIRFTQAALGAEMTVPTLEGEATLSIPAETQTATLFRLRGRGVRSVRSHQVGDLLCRVMIETPVKLTRDQRELLEQFEATFDGDRAAAHSPRRASWLGGVKQFWERMTS